MKILLIRFSSLGDVILTMPVAIALRHLYPSASVELATKAEYEGLFTPPDPFDRVIYLDKNENIKILKSLINDGKYDIIADLHKNLRTALLMPFITAGKKKHYSKGSISRRLFVKTKIRISAFPPVVQKYLKPFGIKEIPKSPWITLKEYERDRGYQILRDTGVEKHKVIGIAPGAKWNTKKWSIKKYIELSGRFERNGLDVVFVFGKGDEQEKDILMHSSSNAKILDTSSYLLKEIIYAISWMDAFVSGDTGLMHLAESAGIPVVTLFGPTTKEFGFFPTNHNSIVIEKDLSCRPCSLHGSDVCIKGDSVCMEGITVDEVEEAVLTVSTDREKVIR